MQGIKETRNTKGMFEIAFKRLKRVFNIQKARLKKKVVI
jgi:hypothetical protein